MFKLAVLFCLVAVALGASIRSVRPRLDGRIVGGSAASIEQFPYQISLQVLGSHICGGSIVGASDVVTAAHCSTYPASWYSIRAGSTNRASGGNVYSLTSLVRHPGYDSYTIENDFALAKISGSFSGANEAAVALPSQGEEVAAGTDAIVTGWGTTTEGGVSSSSLLQVTVPIVSQADCNIAYDGEIADSMICAGLVGVGGKDACQGDSGGPLVAGGKLVGVVSWGYGCARPEYPGVYSRVAYARDWITANSGV